MNNDILDKIKATESEGKALIEEAEAKAEKVIEEARAEAASLLEEKKREIIKRLNGDKAERLSAAKIEKDSIIKSRLEEFMDSLGPLEDNLTKTEESIFNYIKTVLDI